MPLRARLSEPAGPLLGAAVGLLIAVTVTLLQDSVYRADASILLVRQGQPPGSDSRLARAADAAAELFDSRSVAESAIRNLGLDEPPQDLLDRLDVHAPKGSSLVRIEVEAPSKEQARRAAQEVAEVATVRFNDRFAPQTTATVWDPASADEQRVSPKPARNLALGILIGALAGLAFALVDLFRGERPPRPVTRTKKTAPASRRTAPPAIPEPAASVRIHPAPTEQPATGPFILPAFGEWTVRDVERLLDEQGDAFPEQREELELYLDTFRSVAGPDGRLPGDVDLVLEDVFADLIQRAR
jgi:capsular polysaccharide biosynthesis protein